MKEAPVQLTGFSLDNIGIFRSLRLELQPPGPGLGQWTLILGQNGVGKSTLLRSVALALLEGSLPSSLVALHNAPLTSLSGEEPLSGRVVVSSASGRFNELVLRPTDIDFSYVIISKPLSSSRRLVLGYGCRRGSALGGADRDLDFKPIASVLTLFDEAASLIHAETWLKQLRLKKELDKSGGTDSFYDAVIATLCELLPGVESIDVRAEDVWIKGPTIGRIPLSALSDGYLTTMGWIVDMIARWSHKANAWGIELDGAFNTQMTGLVLIDEIDLHLHPRWQVHIVSSLRRWFPRMSFIATTHSPMVLPGLKAHEIFVLEREGDAVTVRQPEGPPALMTGSELFSTYFDMEGLYPDELGELVSRYGYLASNPYRSDVEDEELQSIRERLDAEGLAPEWEPEPRIDPDWDDEATPAAP